MHIDSPISSSLKSTKNTTTAPQSDILHGSLQSRPCFYSSSLYRVRFRKRYSVAIHVKAPPTLPPYPASDLKTFDFHKLWVWISRWWRNVIGVISGWKNQKTFSPYFDANSFLPVDQLATDVCSNKSGSRLSRDFPNQSDRVNPFLKFE